MKISKRIMVLMALMLIAALVAGCGTKPAPQPEAKKETPADIVIGANLELSGGLASFGQSTKEAIELAVEEINAAGGINGAKLVVKFEDNKSTQAEAATVAQKLINQDQVVAIIGAIASSNSLAAGPIAQGAGIPMLSSTSTNPKVTEVGDYIFRACFIDPFQGQVMAKFAAENLGAKTAAIYKDINSDYSKGLADVFREKFTAAGGTIVIEESFAAGDTDFNTTLTRIKGANPDVVFVPAYYNEVGLILNQAKKQGITATFLGTDGWDAAELFTLAGDAVNGHFFSNHYSPESDAPEVQAFLAAYQAKYNKVPDALAALGYDALNLMADAIKRAGSADPKAIRDALAATDGFVGVSGVISLDENRNAVKSAVINGIQDNKFVYNTTVNP